MSLILKECLHNQRDFLVTYKPILNFNQESKTENPKILCKDCFKNPDFVNESIIDLKFNIKSGDLLH